MSHYTVGYLDETRHRREICTYASDSWGAKIHAVEDVPYLHSHPNAIDQIFNEDLLSDTQVSCLM